MKRLIFFFILCILVLFNSAYTPPSYDDVNLTLGAEAYTPPNYYDVNLTLGVVVDTTPPTVSLDFPTDNSWQSLTTITFKGTPDEELGTIDNCSLWTNESGWSLKQTNDTCTDGISCSITDTLAEGSFIWNYECCDNSNNCGFNTTGNFTVNIDLIFPSIDYSANTDSGATWYSKNWAFINVTASDTNKDTVTLEWDGVNESFDNSDGDEYWENQTSLADGNYTFKAYINDSAGNENETTEREVYLDSTNPVISITSPNNNSYHSVSRISILGTVTETNQEDIYINDTIFGANLGTYVSWNFTNLTIDEGSYSVLVTANDSAGNTNSTDVTFTIDRTDPIISFIDITTNSSNLSQSFIEANISASDLNRIDTINQTVWNISDGSKVNSSDSSSSPFFTNFTGFEDGNYTLNATVNDSAGNTGNTESREIVLDTTVPTFSSAVNTSIDFKKYSNFTANITLADSLVGLDFYIFSTNTIGTWSNDSAVDISGASYAASVSKNITQGYGNNTCWYYWSNDTVGNSDKSSTYCFDIVNSPPSIILNAPVNNTTVPDQTYAFLNVTPIDLDGQEMNVSFYSGTGGEECYQETANQSTACGGLATGGYQNDSAFNIWTDCIKSVYDGDWDSSCNGSEGRLFINYTKPTAAVGTVWQVKDENGTYNLTIPDDCWDLYPDKVGFRIRSKADLADWRCKNDTNDDWILLRYNDSTDAGNIFEEAMYWNISVLGTADNISSGDNATFNWTGLTLNTTYTWYTIADDGIDTTTSDTWTFHTPGDTTYPYWSNNGTNATSSTKTGANVYFNVTLTDEYAGGNQIFSFYNGSDWINSSSASWNTPADLLNTTIITATRGMTVSWYWWFDDSYNNENKTDTWSFVVNNTIPVASSVNVTSSDTLNRTNGTLTGSWTYSDTDFDLETDNETQWYKNAVEVINLQNFTSVDSNNLTKGESWIFGLRVYDDYDWSIWVNSSTFTVENAAPNITLNAPADGAVNQSLITTLNVSVDDLDDDNINVTFYQNNTTLLGSIVLRDNLVNTLSDGNSSKVLTFSQADNQTFYITISDHANTTNSANNLTGLIISYVTDYSWQTITQSDFDEGTYNQTFYNASGFVQLNATYNNGTYTSKILNALVDSEWNNISWISNAIGELPANQIIETEFGNGNANMTGNVLLMHFNNDSTYGETDTHVYDFSGMENNGTVTSATWTTAGKLGAGAFNYDGVNDWISVDDTDDLDLQGEFTIMTWFKTNIDDKNQVFIGKGYILYGNYLLMKHQNNAIRFFASADGSSWGTDISGPTINNDIWYHVAITHNGSTTQLYLNGTYKAQDTTPATPAISSDPLNIGRRGFFLLNYLNGTIDEIAIFNRTLSATEILDIYKRGTLKLNLTTRSCDDATCSGESWTDVNDTSPQNLSVINNTYFQYKYEFETENVIYTPELYNVTVDYKKGYNYPENVTLNIGNDSVLEWNQTGVFNYTTTVNDSNTIPVFSSKLNSILTDCTCTGCVHDTTAETCKIPFVLESETPGKINVSNINITYDYKENYFTYIWRGLTPNTTYGWFVSANDGTDETNSSIWYFTTWVFPGVILNAPANGYHINISETITFNCTAGADYILANVSLYLTDSSNSSFVLNETNSTLSGVYLADVIFTKTIGEGNYTWNCLAYDIEDHCSFAPENWSFTSGYIGLRLDGTDDNQSYEYKTMAYITTGANFIDIYDDTGRWRNQVSPFNYTIDLLRQSKFNDSTTSKNISSGMQTTVQLGGEDELYNATFNVTGINNPTNVTITYDDTNNIVLPGILNGSNLRQEVFIFLGSTYKIHNLSFDTAESKTIYINYTNQGDVLNRNGTLNFTITGFNLDIENEFLYNDNFTNKTLFGGTYGDNVSLLTEIDDFGDNDSSKWTMTNGPNGGTMSIINRDYLSLYQERTGAGTFEVDWIYNDEDFDMRTLNKFETNLSFTRELACDRAYEDTSFLNLIYLTDGTTDIQLWGRYKWIDCQDYEIADVYKENIDLKVIKSTKDKIDVYTGGTFEDTFDISALDDNQRQYLKFYSSVSIQLGRVRAVTEYKLWNLSVGGITLKNNNSTFPINAYYNYTSDSLNITPTDIKKATLNATVYNPDNTTINYYLSNDNGTTYESVLNGVTNSFASDGKNISAIFEIKTTNNTSSPRIFDYYVSVVSTELSSLIIDVGDDGITNANYSVLNKTTTPTYYLGNDSSVNLYINRSCNETDCLIPIIFLSGSGGTTQISNFNLTELINPITLNTTLIDDTTINLSSTGHVNITDLKFDYNGHKNITVRAHTGSDEINRTISVFYSKLNVSIFPNNIFYWDLYPSSPTAKNVEPFGQDSNTPFFLYRSMSSHPFDIYMRFFNNTNPACTTTWANNNSSNIQVYDLHENFTNIGSLNGTAISENRTMWTWTNFSCSSGITVYYPDWEWRSLCEQCVYTLDFNNTVTW